jgi:hypothetical protein
LFKNCCDLVTIFALECNLNIAMVLWENAKPIGVLSVASTSAPTITCPSRSPSTNWWFAYELSTGEREWRRITICELPTWFSSRV